MALGLVLGALSGGANAAGQSLAQSEQFRQQQELETQRNNMRLEAEKAAAQFKANLENAPKDRFGAYLKESSAQTVPLESKPITTLDSAGAQAAGLTMGGISGDLEKLRQKGQEALLDPTATDEQKANVAMYLDQLDKQAAGQQSLADKSVEGKTRPVNSLETIQAAIDQAVKNGDAQAAEAGRKMLSDLRVHIGTGGALVDIGSGNVIYQNDTAEKIAAMRAGSQERTQALKIAAQRDAVDKKIEANERAQQLKMDSAVKKSTVDSKDVETFAQAIASNTMKPLGQRERTTPFGQAVVARLLQLNPDWNEQDYAAMDKANKAFSAGNEAKTMRSLNVAVDHIGTAMGLIDALNNKDTNTINKLKNTVAAWAGDVDVTNFEAVKGIVADEITKSVVGGAGALADREEMAKQIRSSNSPDQIKGVLNQFEHLMAGQMNGLRQQYQAATGRDDFEKFLLPKTIDALGGMALSKQTQPVKKGQILTTPLTNQKRPSLSEIFGAH